MKIVVTGAGSGGHITPLLAIANELKKLDKNINIYYIGQTGDRFLKIPEGNENIDGIYDISAGKLRRYHGVGIRQLFDIPMLVKNFRDLFRIVKGLFQSYFLLGKIKPDLIFIKGGYIGVPIGLSAKLRGIPYITHDSDAVPGLANKIIGPWATLHTTALPGAEHSKVKTKNVGVPVSSNFELVTEQLKKSYQKELNISPDRHLLLVTGGGLGAKKINEIFISITKDLLSKLPDLIVIQIVGAAHEEQISNTYDEMLELDDSNRVRIIGYTNDLYKYSGAADLIVTRAGATNLAEYAIQAKPCIVIPNPKLVGGHQLKNAKALQNNKSVVVVEEDKIGREVNILTDQIIELINDSKKLAELSNNFFKYAHPDSAKILADIIYKSK